MVESGRGMKFTRERERERESESIWCGRSRKGDRRAVSLRLGRGGVAE